jgi:hypothetical protein
MLASRCSRQAICSTPYPARHRRDRAYALVRAFRPDSALKQETGLRRSGTLLIGATPLVWCPGRSVLWFAPLGSPAVNAERLHAIVDSLRGEVDETLVHMRELGEVVRRSANNPGDADIQRAVVESREQLYKMLERASSETLSPAGRDALKELKVADLLGTGSGNGSTRSSNKTRSHRLRLRTRSTDWSRRFRSFPSCSPVYGGGERDHRHDHRHQPRRARAPGHDQDPREPPT